MTSKAADVGTYLAELPVERRAAMERLRSLCLKNLGGWEECMAYGMPGYKRGGELKLSIASQKNYISIYGLSKFVDAAPDGSTMGKGCMRFSKPEKIDFAMIEGLLRKASASS
jgi:hypothetical protein